MRPGSTIGGFEILSRIGSGGMGEVYRARDLQLGRDVALKILPAAMAADPGRLDRLRREARMLASLNHPNIAALYAVETSGSTCALVLELVEGETLGARIRRSGLSVAEVRAVARQIAAALDAAHTCAIVHRDLKPENVMLGPRGLVKVLDFGVAKASVVAPAADAPTLSAGPTAEGVIVGTVAYMSPEQARGRPVDRRTDIWAFGCVLYEMLTGRRPFSGETTSDIIVATLERQPDWGALPRDTPPGLRDSSRVPCRRILTTGCATSLTPSRTLMMSPTSTFLHDPRVLHGSHGLLPPSRSAPAHGYSSTHPVRERRTPSPAA